MNLADAIRQAAYAGGPIVPENQQPFVPQNTPQDEPVQDQPQKANNQEAQGSSLQLQHPEHHEHQTASPTLMRMELFLSPEQLNSLLKALVASQHSVMTLREAASYLRMNAATLEDMAKHGDVAAFTVNGRWRFSKAALDEWVTTHTFRKEDSNAA